MRRSLFEDVHEDFRASFRTFLEREVVGEEGRYGDWERAGIVPREVFALAGRGGFLAMAVPEAYGGAGAEDFRLNLVIGEETQRAGVGSVGLGMSVHTDICLPYFLTYCTEPQRERWLGGIASGELITAIAMTEPGMGSDLAAMSTSARREGEHYVVNGTKTFITNGINADLVIVVVRTGEGGHQTAIAASAWWWWSAGWRASSAGATWRRSASTPRTRPSCPSRTPRVPVENLLGREGEGFRYLLSNLPQERLSIAASAVAAAEVALGWTLEYVRERRAFGQPIGSFQASRFTLAEIHGEVQVARVFVDRCVQALGAGELTAEDAATAKWWCTDLQGRVVDRCLQLFGGYGYMLEYPIARAFADARVTRIYGGANEIMKEIVGRSLGL